MLSASRPYLSIILPVKNEEAALEPFLSRLLNHLRRYFPRDLFEIVLVENGSTDRTRSIISALPDSYDSGKIMIRKEHLHFGDYSQAVRHGVLNSTGELITWLGVDIDDIACINRGVAALEEVDSSIVILSKYKGADWRPISRKVLNRVFNVFVRLVDGLWYSDIEGYMVIKSELKPIMAFFDFSRKNALNYHLLFFCKKYHLKIREAAFYVAETRKSTFLTKIYSIIGYNILEVIFVHKRFKDFCIKNSIEGK